MKIFETTIECKLDGQDATVTAVVDQRDHAAYEGSDLYDEEGGRQTLRIRWLAWHALKRAGQTTAGWKEFNERLCVQATVVSVPKVEPEGDDSLDPSEAP